jgi:excisionase family DNA binding protein
MSIPVSPDGRIEFKVEMVAEELHQTREHILYLLRRKRIPGIKLGRKWLIPTREFRIHLRELLKSAIEDQIDSKSKMESSELDEFQRLK